MEKLADISYFEAIQNNGDLYLVQNWSLSSIPLIGGLFGAKKKRATDKIRTRLSELRASITKLEGPVNEGKTIRENLEGAKGEITQKVLDKLSEAYVHSNNIFNTIKYYNKNKYDVVSFIAANNPWNPKNTGKGKNQPNPPKDTGPDTLDACIQSVQAAMAESAALTKALYSLKKDLTVASEYAAKSAELQKLYDERKILDSLVTK